jgi:predicted deacylase
MSNIKVVELKGYKEGNTGVILAGIHGNEVCGVKALDKLIPSLKIKSGKVFFIYCNLEAIKRNKRFIESNLNRCFFDSQSENIADTLEGKTAREIIPFLKKADFVLDIHASNSPDSEPFIICNKYNLRETDFFEGKIAVHNFDKFEKGTTDSYLNQKKICCFGIECGFLGDKSSQKIAENSVLNFLSKFKFIERKFIKNDDRKIFKLISLYKNKHGEFIPSKMFKDFELIEKETLIGLDGPEKVFVNKNNIILFTRERKKLNEECFLVLEED